MHKAGLALAALLGACAGTRPFVPPTQLARVDPARYPDDDAVVLLRDVEERVDAHLTRMRLHERIEVLRKGGLRVAHAVIPLYEGAKLARLDARVIGPHGEARVARVSPTSTSYESAGGQQVPALAFDVPGVEVGSIVEYEWVTERQKSLLSTQETALSGQDPIVNEKVTLEAAAPMIFETRTYATAARPQRHERVVRLALHDVPPDRGEPFAPLARVSQPRLVFRLLSTPDATHTWAGALTGAAELLYGATARLPDSLALARSPVAPSEKRAFLDRANAWLGATSDLLSIGWLETVRPIGSILASHNASSTERAVLLKAQLDRARIESHFAVVGNREGAIDTTFPDSWILGHAVLSIPAQPGIEAPLLVDPTCASCAVGELPPWARPVLALSRRGHRVLAGQRHAVDQRPAHDRHARAAKHGRTSLARHPRRGR